MYMYINQLIVGIQLYYTVTSIRELFLYASFLFSFFAPLCPLISPFLSRRISVVLGEAAPAAR